MKVFLALIPLMLILSGCIDSGSADYFAGQLEGSGSRNAEISDLKRDLKIQSNAMKDITKELERKTEVTRDALNNQSESFSIMNKYNDRLEALELVIKHMDLNINVAIQDLNKSMLDGFQDINESFRDLNSN